MGKLLLIISLLMSSCMASESTGDQEMIVKEVADQSKHNEITDVVKVIKQTVKQTKDQLSSYGNKEVDVFGGSSEGGLLTGFYDSKKLKFAKISYFGEMGKVDYALCFSDSKIIYIQEITSNYDKPIYINDSKVASRDTLTYYLKDEELAFLSKDNSENKSKFNSLLADLKKDISLLGEYREAPIKLEGDTVRCKYGSRCHSTGYVIKGSRNGKLIHVPPPKNKDIPME